MAGSHGGCGNLVENSEVGGCVSCAGCVRDFQNMCEVLDRIENCGIDKGKAEGRIKGRTQVMALMKKLFEQNRIDDAKKASEDAAYYDRLLKELGIN